MNQATTSQLVRTSPLRGSGFRAAGTLVVGVAAGALLSFAVFAQVRPPTASPVFQQSVTDGWARSAITRAGGLGAYQASNPVRITDGWAHSQITRAGGVDAFHGADSVTDGWLHSSITRAGGVGASFGS